MTLLTNEYEILSSNENKIILTNQRIHMNEKDWGRSYSITIFLENISSIEIRYNSNIIFLVLGIISGLFCAANYFSSDRYSGNDNMLGYALIATIFFFLLYWFSKRHVISLSSNGGKPLNFKVSQMKDYAIEDFVDKLQEAKAQRMRDLLNA